MFDVLIKGGRIADGTGKPAYTADLAILNGKIAKIAPQITETAKEVIDAAGLVVAPGFIDVHNHSESFIFTGTDAYNYLEMGVTTQICGNCGESPVPYYEGALRWIKDPEERAACGKLAATPATFMAAAEKASIGVNMGFLIGHDPIRAYAMGYSPDAPDPQQLEIMCDWVRQAMEAGFLGYSTGLIYAPSAYGKTPELIALAKAMAPYGGVYASHVRNEGDGVVEAVEEAIRIGKEAGVPVQISHLKVMGKHNEGLSQRLLQLIEDANCEGLPVAADQYPYEASHASLRSRIPAKYHAGGKDALLERLKDPAVRADIQKSVFESTGNQIGASPIAARDVLISELATHPEYVGMTLEQVAQLWGANAADTLCDLLIESGTLGEGIYFNQNESDILRILDSIWVCCGSDSSNRPDQRSDPETRFGVHPRCIGAFVRRLELQRKMGIRMEDAICRITDAPARFFGLKGHGQLQEGFDGNITVLDYENLRSLSTYEYPHKGNEGIRYVLVNGTVAVREGRCTGSRAGKILKRTPNA